MKKQTKIILGVVAATIATGFGIFIAANNKLITLEENVDDYYKELPFKYYKS